MRTLDRHKGIVVKCWFCIDLVRAVEPACVTTCPTPMWMTQTARFSQLMARGAEPLRPDLDTRVRIFYKRS